MSSEEGFEATASRLGFVKTAEEEVEKWQMLLPPLSRSTVIVPVTAAHYESFTRERARR